LGQASGRLDSGQWRALPSGRLSHRGSTRHGIGRWIHTPLYPQRRAGGTPADAGGDRPRPGRRDVRRHPGASSAAPAARPAASAMLMACRLTGRGRILIPDTLGADRLSQLRGFTSRAAELVAVAHDPATGLLDQRDLAAKLSAETAAVYVETPSHLGIIETG